MRRTPLVLALSVALAATPAALATRDAHPAPDRDRPAHDTPTSDRDRGDRGDREQTGGKGDREETGDRGRGGKSETLYLAQACVVSTTEGTGIEVKRLSVNAHLRRALAGEKTFDVRVTDATKVQLVGRARRGEDGSKLPGTGSLKDLATGDRVTIHIRAPRGTAVDELPAAFRVIDHGKAHRCAALTPPPPPPSTEEPPTETTPTTGTTPTPPPTETTPEL